MPEPRSPWTDEAIEDIRLCLLHDHEIPAPTAIIGTILDLAGAIPPNHPRGAAAVTDEMIERGAAGHSPCRLGGRPMTGERQMPWRPGSEVFGRIPPRQCVQAARDELNKAFGTSDPERALIFMRSALDWQRRAIEQMVVEAPDA